MTITDSSFFPFNSGLHSWFTWTQLIHLFQHSHFMLKHSLLSPHLQALQCSIPPLQTLANHHCLHPLFLGVYCSPTDALSWSQNFLLLTSIWFQTIYLLPFALINIALRLPILPYSHCFKGCDNDTVQAELSSSLSFNKDTDCPHPHKALYSHRFLILWTNCIFTSETH